MSKYQFRIKDENEAEYTGRSFKKFSDDSRKTRAFDDESRKERRDTKKLNKPSRTTERGMWS